MMVEEERGDSIVRAMSDKYARRIVSYTSYDAKSIEEISRENEIPMSTCYRRVNELTKSGLMRVDRIVITAQGKKSRRYKSELREATITLISDRLSVNVQ